MWRTPDKDELNKLIGRKKRLEELYIKIPDPAKKLACSCTNIYPSEIRAYPDPPGCKLRQYFHIKCMKPLRLCLFFMWKYCSECGWPYVRLPDPNGEYDDRFRRNDRRYQICPKCDTTSIVLSIN